MKNRCISQEQFGALLWAGALAPVVELLPSVTLNQAGRGAWLSPLVALVVLAPFFWKIGRLGNILTAREQLGTVLGTAFLLVYAAWLEFLLTMRLGLCVRRLLASGRRDGSSWFFLIVLTSLVLWIGMGKLSAFARAGQVFLTLLVAVGVSVLLLSVTEVRVDWLLPLWKEDAMPIIKSALPAAGTILWSMIPMLCLPVEEHRHGRVIWRWGIGGCLALVIVQIVIFGNLGTGLTAESENPFFTLTKSVGIEGAFQRVEGVVAALWVLADITLLGTLLYAIREIAFVIIPNIKTQWISTVGLLFAAGCAGYLCLREMRLEEWNESWILIGNLGFAFGGTTLLYVGNLAREKLSQWIPWGEYAQQKEKRKKLKKRVDKSK